ncbi:hypothetical protein N7510_009969 [Penicillium lagena]|uniref:uncharacterized protein n=1 Tax=Penicillium lagena TaxID=94218 RepID=UPI002541EF59|nr:uncharacterized protein N7510_009969 [Penicillium lagena]KAJ5604815.1 hypothetical protein N7510_009969 [Penicillium lagena]
MRSKEKKAKSAIDDLPPLVRSLGPSMDEIGVNYFLRCFVFGGQTSSRGCLNYLPSVYHADGEQPTLVASMAAVGLVALANSTQEPALASHARIKYSKAVCEVNTALASPIESVKDSTLMSVISLGVFEHISKHESWARHVEGAAALVVARGKSQFSSPLAIRMFNQVRADLVVVCVHGAKPFPKDMLDLQEEASKHPECFHSFWQLGVLSTRCANLLMSVRGNKKTGKIPWSDLLEEATTLDGDFHDLSGCLAEQEPYKTRESEGDPNIIYNGRVDLYQDSWAIRLWNNMRSLRMITCEIACVILNIALATNLAPADRECIKLRLQKTMQTLSTLGDDILATVPQALESLFSASKPGSPVNLSFDGNVSGGYMLTWGLYMVGKSPAATSGARQWIIRLLQDVYMNAGLSIALQIAEHIRQIEDAAKYE